MKFGVLGPVGARVDGEPVALGGPKPRALLAILLLRANNVVSRDRLIEGLWGESPPPNAAHSLDDYLSRLRKVLGADRIERRAPGYVLRVERDESDVAQFERLAEQGFESLARGDAAEATRRLSEALELWRGPALADVLYEPFASLEAERLEDRRLSVLEGRFEADLACGAGPELVNELERLVHEHPLRERFVGQLMLALYRSGRQASALEVFRATRRRFADELGIEPNPQLQTLERQILEHDPALDPPLDARHVAPPEARQHEPRTRWSSIVASPARWALIPAAAGAAVLVIVAIALHTGSGRTTAPQPATGTRNELVAVDVDAARVERTSPLGVRPGVVTSGSDALWVAESGGAAVLRVDPASGNVIDRIPAGAGVGDVTVGGGAVWVASAVGGTITRIDPETGTITKTIRLGVNQSALAFADGQLWVADPADAALIRLDAATGVALQTIPLTARPSSVRVGGGAVWVASHDAATVMEVDPRSNEVVATVPVGQGPTALAIGSDAVWVANNLDGTVSRIDRQTANVTSTTAVGSGPSSLALAGGFLWVANQFSGDVSVIDPATNQIVRTVEVGGRPVAIANVAGRVWIGTAPSGTAHRGGTLTLLGFRPLSIDPAFNALNYPPPQFLGLAYDTLVTFEHTAGPDGLHIVPDLAVALPTVTNAGTTYAFRLRPGIRYADGSPLRASDFRRTIERLFRLHSPGSSLFASIVGGSRCSRHPRSCELKRGILVNDAARTIVFQLRGPDPQLPFKLAVGFSVPIPSGTPNRDIGFRPFPGTGPYRIAASGARETRFVRNPRFREWSHAAQPAGFPDAIVWRYGLSTTAQVQAVREGRADWMFEQIPPKLFSQIEIGHAAQLHVSPALAVVFLHINTLVPPFDKLAARQALNFAIDRREIVRLFGGPSLATPTCQVLPPGIPGYRSYCPYTLHPTRGGRWSGPDVARARRLVRSSDTHSADVNLWGSIAAPSSEKKVLRYAAKVLRRLGYHARARFGSENDLERVRNSGTMQLGIGTWFGGELGPADFLQSFFTCDAPYGNGWFCDKRVDRLIRRAIALETTDRKRAAATWAEADRGAVDAAGWVPLVTPHQAEFVAARLRNYQYHPIWGFIADQAWIR